MFAAWLSEERILDKAIRTLDLSRYRPDIVAISKHLVHFGLVSYNIL